MRIVLIAMAGCVAFSCAAKRPPSDFGIHGLDGSEFKGHWGRSEIKELPHILGEGEVIRHAVYAKRESGGNGLLLATDSRLLFVDKGMLYGLTVQEFPYGAISSVRYNTGLVMGKVFLVAEGYTVFFEQVDNEMAKSFCEFVTRHMATRREEKGR